VSFEAISERIRACKGSFETPHGGLQNDALTRGWPCQKQHKNAERPSRRVMGAVLRYGVSLGSLCAPDAADTKGGGTVRPNEASRRVAWLPELKQAKTMRNELG
jgi:hypothetical protein